MHQENFRLKINKSKDSFNVCSIWFCFRVRMLSFIENTVDTFDTNWQMSLSIYNFVQKLNWYFLSLLGRKIGVCSNVILSD